MRLKDLIWVLAIILIAFLVFDKIQEKKEIEQVQEQLTFQKASPEIPETQKKEADLSKQKNTETLFSRRNAITNAVEKVEPSVVSINVIKTKIVRRRLSLFFNFYDEIPYNVKGIGSGVIFNENGYIITNAHVVEGATEIKIILTDNRQFDGEIIGLDEVHDIAILKIEGENIPHARLGTSDDLIIGEWSIALGNPYAFLIKDSKPSVSVGVISAVNRDFAENQDGKIYRRMIQTDAAINQGNSGGPLVNINGEVIGINSFIFSESGGNIGIGFAIPINRVKEVAQELIEYGKIREIWFGFKVQDLNPMLASYLGLKDLDGVLVNKVQENGPAAKAGLKKLDIITKINGLRIKDTADAELAVSDISVGDHLLIEVLRENKKIQIEILAKEYK